jgi:hypothetical protein
LGDEKEKRAFFVESFRVRYAHHDNKTEGILLINDASNTPGLKKLLAYEAFAKAELPL